ncbi:MAG TPA: hypothetical protein VME66_13970, partial [Candidatus Acidoferrales bacterium]|nr:hypothetical protein [Candidatus Acidoferrales bacterium]
MRRGLVLVGTLLIVVATAVAAHDALAYAAIRATAGLLGYGVRAASFTVGFKSLSVRDLSVVNSAGEPVFALQRGYIAYSLRDLLPGGRRRFGLQAVDLGAPTLTLIHHADGSYNVPVPNLSNPNAQPNEPPIDMRIRIRNGTVVLLDEYIVPHHERRERIEGLHFDAVFSPSRHSYYNSGFALNDGGRSYPVFGRAVFSTARGFSSQHWYAKQLPIGPLFDFALSSHALNLADGTLVGLDARLYTIVSPAGVSTGLISASAQLKDGKLYAAQLAKPVRDAHGPMHLFNDGIETTGLTATLAGVPLHLVGGIYNPTAPNVRFYLTGDGDLARLRQIAAQAQRQDVRGRLLFSLFIEGSLQQPLVFARFRAPVMDYERFPLNGLRGLVAFSGTRLDVLSSGVSYGPLFLSARGSVKLERRVAATLVGDVRGETRSLPYAAQLIPAEHFDGTAVVRGVDRQLGSSGILLASGPGGHLSAPFSVDENGTGAIGPVALVRSDGGSMAGDVLLDRPDDAVLASLDASQLRIGSAPSAPLPGVLLAPLPPIDGTLDAHATALVRAANLVTAHMHLDLNQDHRVVADLQGNASAQGETAAVTGRLQASLGALARAVGSGAASGAVDARFSALRRGATTVVQVADAQFSHARLDGVPIQQARAT